jgi:hypothetical protein
VNPEVRTKVIVGVGAALLYAFLVWWGSFDSVNDILEHPGDYETRNVHLYGEVGSAYNLPLAGTVYLFRDTSGDIWVVSERQSTFPGKTMYLRARVKAVMTIEELGLSEELTKVFKVNAREDRELPPVLVEVRRGGILLSLKAMRSSK